MNCQRCRIVPLDPIEYSKGIRRCPRCRRKAKHLPAEGSIQEPRSNREEELSDELIAVRIAEVRSLWRDGVQKAL